MSSTSIIVKMISGLGRGACGGGTCCQRVAKDVERFRFLQSLPGAYVFVQRYRPGMDAGYLL
jgi:hypothetical protein